MQSAVQSVRAAPAARCTARRQLAASGSKAVAVRRAQLVQRLRAAQVGGLSSRFGAQGPSRVAHCAELVWSSAAG